MSEPIVGTPNQQRVLCEAEGNTWLDSGDGHPRCLRSSKVNWWLLIGLTALVGFAVYATKRKGKSA